MSSYNVGEIIKGKVQRFSEKELLVDIEGDELVGIVPYTEWLPVKLKKDKNFDFKIVKVEDETLVLSMIIGKENGEERIKRFEKLGISFSAAIPTNVDSPRYRNIEEEEMIERQIQEDAYEYIEKHS